MLSHLPESSNDNPLAGFNPAIHPILATHVFGITTDTLRRARLVDHLHQLGPRPVLELLSEIALEHHLGDEIDARLKRYGQLAPDTVAVVALVEVR